MCTRTTGCAMYKLDFSLSVRCIVSCRTWLLSAMFSLHDPALELAAGSSFSHSKTIEHRKQLSYIATNRVKQEKMM